MNKQKLASKIWESANKMRSKIEANEYKDYILGFIFYKYLSDKEVKWLKSNDFSDSDIKALNENDIDTVEFIQKGIGYFIAYKDLFSTWLELGKDFDVSNVRDALSAFNRLIYSTHKHVFTKVFDTLQTGLSKLGDSSGAQTKAINGLMVLIKDIPMDVRQDYDVLGFVYEYLISMFAANAGKKAGEFYTPHEVSLLMSEIVAHHLRGKNEIRIYDPTSGSGSLLINIGQSISKYISDKNKIKYYAQELKENTYNLTRMNLVMRGIEPYNIVTRNGDTLANDWPYFDDNDPIHTYDPLYMDAVVSNPPYSQAWDPSASEGDVRYTRFGYAPKGKADYAFLLHDLYHVNPEGIMTIVLPHGVLFRGGEEGAIRKNLIENNHIDAIIGLPANIFFGTGIPTIIMVLKQKRAETDVLIIDASKGFVKEGKNNKLRASDIKKITDAFIQRGNVEKFARVVSREEIRSNDYNLNIPRYVDSSDRAESWDLYASMFGGIPNAEIDLLKEYWTAFPTLRSALFSNSDIPYVDIKVDNIKNEISNHPDVKHFKKQFQSAFASFAEYLKDELLNKMNDVNVTKEITILSKEIFQRLESIPLIDRYEAFQLLSTEWSKISIDLEIIQTEGFDAIRKVNPNMVSKKKDGVDLEVQEGYVGHVIPFELVQGSLLESEASVLKNMENRLSEILSIYEEIIDGLTEEEKDTEVINDNVFVGKEIPKKLKELKDDDSEEMILFRSKLEQVDNLMKEEKEIKIQIKKESAALQVLSKKTIENLSDDQVHYLLEKKWIESLINNLHSLPDAVINVLVKKIEALNDKYKQTYFAIETQIKETEMVLSSMIDDLVGDEFDMKGLAEFKVLLMGDVHE